MFGPLRSLAAVLVCALGCSSALAVSTNGTYVTTEPTSTDVANWDTGWGASGITGWDYVGSVNGASGVYLGNGWVITAGHVGSGNFTLGGVTYSILAGSTVSIGTADIVLFQITTVPTLPALTIRSTALSTASYSTTGSTVVLIGNGGGAGKSWGANLVTATNVSAAVSGYTTTDFGTVYGSKTYSQGRNSRTITNNAILVSGDSGGGAFVFNTVTSEWELAGINEAVGTASSGGTTESYSFMVQLSTYADQINSIVAVPEPSLMGVFVGVGGLLFPIFTRLRRRLAPPLPPKA